MPQNDPALFHDFLRVLRRKIGSKGKKYEQQPISGEQAQNPTRFLGPFSSIQSKSQKLLGEGPKPCIATKHWFAAARGEGKNAEK